MNTRFVSTLFTLALTLSTGAAFAGNLPACGEGPFFEDSVGPSTLTRAEVVAAAVAAPPAAGEMSGTAAVATAAQAQSERSTVVAELLEAIRQGHLPMSGEAG